jgi:hypothetical protein
MTYLECYNAVVERLKSATYPVHEVYSQGLKRPCIVVEGHPGESSTLNACGVMNRLDFIVTFMPELDDRHNIKNQRDMMAFVDQVLELYLERRLSGMTLEVTPQGNAVTECYIKISAQFAHTMFAQTNEELIDDVVLCISD